MAEHGENQQACLLQTLLVGLKPPAHIQHRWDNLHSFGIAQGDQVTAAAEESAATSASWPTAAWVSGILNGYVPAAKCDNEATPQDTSDYWITCNDGGRRRCGSAVPHQRTAAVLVCCRCIRVACRPPPRHRSAACTNCAANCMHVWGISYGSSASKACWQSTSMAADNEHGGRPYGVNHR